VTARAVGAACENGTVADNPNTLEPRELVELFVAQATALRDQEPGVSAQDVAELARTVTRRQPSYQPWGHTERCPEEPMTDLMRQTMNGDGFHATTAGRIRAAAAAEPSRHSLFDRLAMRGLAPLPRELPEDDGAHVLLYDVKRNTVLTALAQRDDAGIERDVQRLLRDVDRDRRSYENEQWYLARDY